MKALDRDVSSADESAVGLERGSRTRSPSGQFCSPKERPARSAVRPTRGNFSSIFGRRVRALALSDAQKGVTLSWGMEYRTTLRKDRCSKSKTAARARDRDSAARANPGARTCPN